MKEILTIFCIALSPVLVGFGIEQYLDYHREHRWENLGEKFVACDYGNEFMTFYGFKDKQECRNLHEALFREITDKCSTDFEDKRLYHVCLGERLDLELLGISQALLDFKAKP